MRAPPHPREAARLAQLHDAGLLDTPREAEYDALASLAARICEVPVALVSLVDAERQWFKAAVGFDADGTDMERSICSHAIQGTTLFEIPDTAEDPRTADNPLCIRDGDLAEPVRFYAGIPLIPEGSDLPYGTLCVLDTRPRTLTAEQRDSLTILAGQVVKLIELHRALATAESLRQETDHRVKNSLQAVAGFARMQRRAVALPETEAALLAVEARIDAVAALHEALCLSEVGRHVDLEAYVQRIADLVGREAPEGVRLEVSVEPVEIGTLQASPLGMLVNEFAANSFRHAFPGGRRGTVRISGAHGADGMYEIRLADDGIGLAASTGTGSTGLGLKIVSASLEQLQADTLSHDAQTGTGLAFAFRPD